MSPLVQKQQSPERSARNVISKQKLQSMRQMREALNSIRTSLSINDNNECDILAIMQNIQNAHSEHAEALARWDNLEHFDEVLNKAKYQLQKQRTTIKKTIDSEDHKAFDEEIKNAVLARVASISSDDDLTSIMESAHQIMNEGVQHEYNFDLHVLIRAAIEYIKRVHQELKQSVKEIKQIYQQSFGFLGENHIVNWFNVQSRKKWSKNVPQETTTITINNRHEFVEQMLHLGSLNVTSCDNVTELLGMYQKNREEFSYMNFGNKLREEMNITQLFSWIVIYLRINFSVDDCRTISDQQLIEAGRNLGF